VILNYHAKRLSALGFSLRRASTLRENSSDQSSRHRSIDSKRFQITVPRDLKISSERIGTNACGGGGGGAGYFEDPDFPDFPDFWQKDHASSGPAETILDAARVSRRASSAGAHPVHSPYIYHFCYYPLESTVHLRGSTSARRVYS